MRNRSYEFVSWEEEGIWTSHAPSFPGAYGLGKTPGESEKDLSEAVSLMMSYMVEVGEEVPAPRHVRTGQLSL